MNDYTNDKNLLLPDGYTDIETKSRQKDQNDKTYLMAVCSYGDLYLVKEVYKLNPLFLNLKTTNGKNALYYAVYCMQYENLFFLLSLPDIVIDNDPRFPFLSEIKSDTRNGLNLIRYLMEKYQISNSDPEITSMLSKTYEIDKKIAPFFKPDITPELKLAFEHDNLPLFKLHFMNVGFDAFVIACEYNATEIALYCIEQKFGLNYIIPNLRVSAFTFVCYHNNLELAQEILFLNPGNKRYLLCRDKFGKRPLDYISNDSMNSIKMEVLTMPEEEIDNDADFRVFTDADMEMIDFINLNESGTYGDIKHFIDRQTGIEMTLKQYSKCQVRYPVIDESTAKEITFLRMANRLNPNLAVKVYGVFFKNNCIYLVLESLLVTLDHIFKITKSYNLESKRIYYKNILHNLLDILNSLNGYGIIHNDIKSNNIMMDYSGRLKLIDFGMSEFFGIRPDKVFIECTLESLYHPFDGQIVQTGTQLMHPPLRPPRKTLNLDVYSVGIMMINIILGANYEKFLYDGQVIIKYGPGLKSYRIVPETELYNFDPKLADLIKRMLHFNPNIRPFAKECLQDEYFTGIPNANFFPKNVIPTLFPLYLGKYQNYSIINNELIYMDEIHQANKDAKFVEVNTEFDAVSNIEYFFKRCVSWLFKICKQLKLGYESFLNVAPKIFNMITNEENASLISKRVVAYLIIETYHFDCKPVEPKDYVKLCKDLFTVDQIEQCIKDYVATSTAFETVFVKSEVSYLMVNLQIRAFEANLIETIIKYVVLHLHYWVVVNRGKQYEIWKLISNIYRLGGFPWIEDFFDEIDPELMERLQDNVIVKEEYDFFEGIKFDFKML